MVEAAGISTISLSMVPALTAAMGAPRVAAIEFPFGHPLGQPGDADTQREVLRATLMALRNAEIPGTVTDLAFRWPEPASEVHWHPKEPSPIGRLLAANPSLFGQLVAGEIPPAASRRIP
jgi:D-proline reductase (dithiol) PrdB